MPRLGRRKRGPSQGPLQQSLLDKDAKRSKKTDPGIADWSIIPNDILFYIFTFVSESPTDLLACRLVCQSWFCMCEAPMFWSRVIVTVSERTSIVAMWYFLTYHEIRHINSSIHTQESMEKLLCCVSPLSTFRTDRYEQCSKVVRSAAQLESKLSSVDHLILKCRRTSPRKETNSRMVEKDMVATLGFLTSLKTLHLEGFHQLKLDKRSISGVRKLTLHKCLPVDLIAISQSFQQLEELHISQCTVTAKHVKVEDLEELRKGISPHLHTLVIVHSDVKAQGFPLCEGLRHCDLSFCHLEEDVLVNMLGTIKDSSLTHLNLSCEMHARLNLSEYYICAFIENEYMFHLFC